MGRAITRWAPTFITARILPHPFLLSPCISTMTDSPQEQKDQSSFIPALDLAITGLNIAKDATSGTPVNPVFGPVVALLTMIRVCFLPFLNEIFHADT